VNKQFKYVIGFGVQNGWPTWVAYCPQGHSGEEQIIVCCGEGPVSYSAVKSPGEMLEFVYTDYITKQVNGRNFIEIQQEPDWFLHTCETIKCEWFLPYVNRMVLGETVSLNELKTAYHAHNGRTLVALPIDQNFFRLDSCGCGWNGHESVIKSVTTVHIIGQQLIDNKAWVGFGKALGIVEAKFGLESWSGMGPHSAGGYLEIQKVREDDCIDCGASWFLPFLTRMKSGEVVSVKEMEAAYLLKFGKPMIKMNDQKELIEHFNSHVRSGATPQSFFGACRIVKWDAERQCWIEIFSSKWLVRG
jgi:hypothetical protein